MFNTEFGFLNKLLAAMGLDQMNFLSENVPAFISCMVLNLWMALPFMIMMMDSALQSVDRSYYESAKLDGAGFWTRNWYITIPSIKPVLAPAVIMTTFTTFKQFDIVYLLTMQKGSYSGATLQTVITYAHQNAFVSNNYGLSSAVSIIIFLFIIIFNVYEQRSERSMSNRKKVRRLVGLTTLNLIFIAICIVTLVPILYAVTLSISGSGGALSSGLTFIPESPTLDNYRAILMEEPFLLWLKNSAILSVGTMIVAMEQR